MKLCSLIDKALVFSACRRVWDICQNVWKYCFLDLEVVLWLPYSFSVLKRRQVIQAMRGSLRWKVSLESSTKAFFVFGKESENGHIRENPGSFILWYISYARESIICFFNIAVNIIMGLNTKHLLSVKLVPFPLDNLLYKIPT